MGQRRNTIYGVTIDCDIGEELRVVFKISGYLIDVGVLLSFEKTDSREYDNYSTVYGGGYGFYDENQYMSKDLDFAVQEVKTYISNGVSMTYGVITRQDFFAEPDEISGCCYDKEVVMYSAYKNENGELVENFIKN